MLISPNYFVQLICTKQRQFRFTSHALNRAEKRLMQLEMCKEEILKTRPELVKEQKSTVNGERQFDVYYRQDSDKYHRYIVALNNSIHIITMMRVSRNLQSKWEKIWQK